jgi:RsiW-degrading membrane proteinase PrsW (M82 family)
MQPETAPSVEGSRKDWMAIAQLALSGLGMAFSLFGAGFTGLMGLILLVSETSQRSSADTIFALAAISLFVALAAVPSLLYSMQRLMKRPIFPRLTQGNINGLRVSTLLLLVWPLVLVLGNLILERSTLSWLLLPPLLLLAAGIPTWWLIELARRGLPSGSRQRIWGLFNFSIFITTPLLMLVEVVAMLILLVLVALLAGMNPQLMTAMQDLVARLEQAPTPEAIIQLVAPLLTNPWAVFGLLSVFSGLVPLVEEMLKPLAVWLIAGRRPSPAEGFVAGVLCGAGFGVIESMLYLTEPAQQSWAFLAAGRAGAILLHISTTALIGWAMALAWNKGSYARLGATYLLAVLLHGLWNGLALLTGFSSIFETAPENMRLVYEISRLAPFGVSALAVTLFGLLLWSSQFLRDQTRRAGLPVESQQLTP